MNFINKIVLILLTIGVLISDRWLNRHMSGFNASYFIFPFLILSFTNYSVARSKIFIHSIFWYIGVLFLFFLFSGAQGYVLLTTAVGTALIALASFNMNYRVLIINFLQPIYIFLTLLIAVAYYFGFWETRSLTSERLTFMYNNENITAQQLCEGLAFCLFIGLSKTKRARTFLLFIAALFVIPIAATLSRTGFALMIIQFGVFAYARLKAKGVLATAFAGLAISAIGILPSLGILTNNKIVEALAERSAETAEDIRFQLWEISWEIAQENILTGVGFGNYVSDVYRYRIGEKANLGFEGFGSPHNSFIDLIWIGGIWLVIIYSLIILRAIQGGLKLIRSSDIDLRMIGALVISLAMGIILFSMTAQAATDKRTWLIFAICYLWIEEGKQRQQLMVST